MNKTTRMASEKEDFMNKKRREIDRATAFVNNYMYIRFNDARFHGRRQNFRLNFGDPSFEIHGKIEGCGFHLFRKEPNIEAVPVTGQSLRIEEIGPVHNQLYDVASALLADTDFAEFAELRMADDGPMTSGEFAEILGQFKFGDAVRFSIRQAHTSESAATPDHVYFIGVGDGFMLCVSKAYFDSFLIDGNPEGTGLRMHAAVDALVDIRKLRRDGEIASDKRHKLVEYAHSKGIKVKLGENGESLSGFANNWYSLAR